jgi:biopolymer transport protein ExbD
MHLSYNRNGLGGLFLLAAMGISALGGCDDKKETPTARPPVASVSVTPEAPPAPPADKIPDVSVDNQGLYMGGERVVLSAPDGPRRLKETVGKYKLDGKSVIVVALRVAKTPEVATVVKALADAGVADLTLRTQDRAKHDTNLKIVPEKKLGKLPECTVVTMMLKDRTTASWSIRGGTAIKYPKGMAGPDMSQTLEGVTKQVNSCSSTTLLFSGDDAIEWGLTFDLATKISMAEPPLKIVSYGLLSSAPVAGRPVKVTEP